MERGGSINEKKEWNQRNTLFYGCLMSVFFFFCIVHTHPHLCARYAYQCILQVAKAELLHVCAVSTRPCTYPLERKRPWHPWPDYYSFTKSHIEHAYAEAGGPHIHRLKVDTQKHPECSKILREWKKKITGREKCLCRPVQHHTHTKQSEWLNGRYSRRNTGRELEATSAAADVGKKKI